MGYRCIALPGRYRASALQAGDAGGIHLYIAAFGVLTEIANPGTAGEKWTEYLSVGNAKVGMRVK